MGDYIDRDPDTRAHDILIERSRRGNAVFLKGNHEAVLVNVLEDPSLFDDWLRVGGAQTLMAYGIAPGSQRDGPASLLRELLRAMPTEHVEFLDNLRLSFTCGDFFFVQAGVRPSVALSDLQENHPLWIRDEFLQSQERFGKYLVHGHTPARSRDLRHDRANIDTGAYATGNLTLMTIQASGVLAFQILPASAKLTRAQAPHVSTQIPSGKPMATGKTGAPQLRRRELSVGQARLLIIHSLHARSCLAYNSRQRPSRWLWPLTWWAFCASCT